MYINIELEQKKSKGPLQELTTPPKFKIEIEELLDAIENCYTQLGTPYDPIKIDNFVTVGKNAFSAIDKETTVSVSLIGDERGSSKIIEQKLVCCMLKIVDKKFINSGEIADSNHWGKIFKPHKDLMYTPDGTLYILPNNNICVISTKGSDEDCNISYSILLSLKVKLEKEKPRRFYFILDPLVKISSGVGTNPGGGGGDV